MHEILSIIVCAVIGILFTWISERGKNKRSSTEAAAMKAHDDHRERVRRHIPPMPAPPVTKTSEPPLPDEGVRCTADTPAVISNQPVKPETTRTQNARTRWKQAIIDSEILTRKY